MACHKDADRFSGDYPCCFQATIDYFLSQPTIHASIDKYLFNNEYVYAINDNAPNSADMNTAILKANCELLFYFGGFAGSNCGSLCDEWVEEAEFVEVVWEDTR